MNNRLILLQEKFGRNKAIFFFLLENKANVEHGRITVNELFAQIRSTFGGLAI